MSILEDPINRRIVDWICNNPGISEEEISKTVRVDGLTMRLHNLLTDRILEKKNNRFFPVQLLRDKKTVERTLYGLQDLEEKFTTNEKDLQMAIEKVDNTPVLRILVLILLSRESKKYCCKEIAEKLDRSPVAINRVLKDLLKRNHVDEDEGHNYTSTYNGKKYLYNKYQPEWITYWYKSLIK